MYQIDRFVAIVRPEQPFLDWLNGLAEYEPMELALEQVQEDCTALLVPQFEDEEEAASFVCKLWDQLFEAELQDWADNRALWPQDRSIEMFMEWFSVHIHTTVVDLVEDESAQ